jgi:hypothetical protein
MLRLLMYAAGGWALYRAGQASIAGVPVMDAILSPLTSVTALAATPSINPGKLRIL